MPEQLQRLCTGSAELSEQLRELVYGGDKLLRMGARLVIEIVPVDENGKVGG